MLKNKDTIAEDSGNKKKTKEQDSVPTPSSKENEGKVIKQKFAVILIFGYFTATTPQVKQMKKCMKLIEDGVINTDHLQDYLQENSDFVVVGVVGPQGVGKSTLLNLLADKKVSEPS